MSEVILKFQDAARQTHKVNKLLGNVSLSSLVDLLSTADLEANPRLSKVSRVTDDIEESLETEGEIFHFMSKGILVAASEVEELERNRFRLKFEDPELEGILDGGHNSLAAGRFILRFVLTAEHGEETATKMLKAIKGWAQLKEAWEKYLPLIKTHRASLPTVLMPVEAIYPAEGNYEYFQDKVLTINAARNNNAELTMETRANKRGYYAEMRMSLDDAIRDQVEWKSNDGGRIKVRDLIALALVPLSKLTFAATEQVRRGPTVIFSSKGQCVGLYDKLMEEEDVVSEIKGNIVEITHPGVKSALAMMKDLPRLYDLLYAQVPHAYNQAGGKFGKIDGVSKSNGKTYKSRFYRAPVEYSYGEGYIYPLFYGLSALMKVENGEVKWTTDPDKFLKAHLVGIMKSFNAMISGQNYDPAKVGKSHGAYNLASDLVSAALKDEILRQHGLA